MSRVPKTTERTGAESPGLPAFVGGFHGRESLVDGLTEAVEDHPIVSIVGPPGVGKTRLSVEAGQQLADAEAFDEGVWFCDLRAARTGVDIIASVADALDLPLSSRRDPEGAAEFLRTWTDEHPTLVILDNFEQLVDSGRELLEQWFSVDAAASAVVTTRRPLGLDLEHRIELSPLGGEEATTLYIERGESASRFGSVDGVSQEAVEELVERLDYLPLAIELAAARLPVLGPHELLERLDRQLDVLQQPSDSLSNWHPALREALEGSWSLLEDWERSALMQLAVFRGAFSIEAAESVVDLGTYDGAPPVPRVLHMLLEHSLIRQDESMGGRRFFSLFESVREFAEDKSDGADTEVEGARRRHAEWFAGRVQELKDEFNGEDAQAACSEFAAQSGNVRKAFAWAAENAPILATTIGGPLVMFLNIREPFQDDLAVLETADKALEAADDSPEVERARVRVDHYFAKRWVTRGEAKRAREYFDSAMEAAREHGFDILRLELLKDLGHFWVYNGDLDQASEVIEEGFELLEELGDFEERETLEAALLCHAGNLAHHRTKLEDARRHYNRSLTVHRQAGNLRYTADVYHNLGLLESGFGEFERAAEFKRKAYAIHEQLEELAKMAATHGDLGHTYTGLGDLKAAAEEFDAAIELAEKLKHGYLLPEFLGGRAFIEFERGNIGEAATMLDEALSLADRLPSKHVEVVLQARLGALNFARGRVEEGERNLEIARERLGEIGTHRSELAVEVASAQRHLVAAKGALEEGEFTVAGEHLDEAKELAGYEDESKLLGNPDAFVFGRVIGRRIRDFEEEYSEELEAAGEALHVAAEDCNWFEWDDERVDVSRRGAPRRILARLVRERLESPGSGVDSDGVVEAGWPDQTIHPEAAKSRVYTAIRTLRDFGLRDILLTNDEGYYLDPEVPVVQH